MQSRLPLILAIVLLLLPVLYVGSYLALVVPEGIVKVDEFFGTSLEHYRVANKQSRIVFYPLAKFDRWLRPAAWDWDAWDQRRAGR